MRYHQRITSGVIPLRRATLEGPIMLTQSMMRGLAVKLDLTDLLQPRGREREHQLTMRQPLLLTVGTKLIIVNLYNYVCIHIYLKQKHHQGICIMCIHVCSLV